MNREQFETLVNRLEAQARAQPGLYRAKVLGLAMLGNAYLGGALLLLLAVMGAMVAAVATLHAIAIKILLVVAVFGWQVLKSLWVKMTPPEGTELSPLTAPGLFGMIEELRHKLRAPRFHHVLITADYNAGVSQIPRLGIFGWHQNYLLIGLPLLKTLTVEQFRAVLAHEFGHLARGHGRFGHWIYRLRMRWAQLIETLEQQRSRGDFMFRPFFNWYSPYFSAYSFPLARADEYEADATAAQLTSPRTVAEALTGVSVIGNYLSQKYWPQLFERAREEPRPGFMPYVGMSQRIAAEVDMESAKTLLDQVLAEETGCANTHPALTDRLKAVGAAAAIAPPGPGESADTLLGDAAAGLVARFDEQWLQAVLPHWEQRHREAQENRTRLEELDTRAAEGELEVGDAFSRAMLTESVRNDEDGALEQLRAVHARAPEDAYACLALGSRLLNRDDDAGIEIVKGALKGRDQAAMQACELMRDYNWRHGRKKEADDWHQQVINVAQHLQAADQERSEVLVSDKFEPHQLDDETVARVREQLRQVPGLRKAYLVRKQVKRFAEQPCYLLGYSTTPWYKWSSSARTKAALDAIQQHVELPAGSLIISIDGDNSTFGRKMRKVKMSRLV